MNALFFQIFLWYNTFMRMNHKEKTFSSRHCERSEAIQLKRHGRGIVLSTPQTRRLDCRATLAMTAERRA